MDSKPDSSDIRAVLEELRTASWLRGERQWWPRFLFHYTDVCNVPLILASGCLLCRSEAEVKGELLVSSGSPEELAHTSPYVKQCVRLYFRPKTPTQYHSEGIKSAHTLEGSRYPTAHCPVPVFLLFDSAAILTRADSMFSNGGLNTLTPQLFSTAADLRAMPWRLVYHVGPFDRASDRSIVYHRQAEVVVPSALDLESLQWIVCRSQAEKDTLMYLLTPALRDRYQRRILASGRLSLHYRQHTYVDRAVLSRESILLSFSPDTKSPGPFAAEYTITICGRERQVARTLQANSDVELRFGEPMSSYEVMLRLDGHIAYAGSYTDSDMVF